MHRSQAQRKLHSGLSHIVQDVGYWSIFICKHTTIKLSQRQVLLKSKARVRGPSLNADEVLIWQQFGRWLCKILDEWHAKRGTENEATRFRHVDEIDGCCEGVKKSCSSVNYCAIVTGHHVAAGLVEVMWQIRWMRQWHVVAWVAPTGFKYGKR